MNKKIGILLLSAALFFVSNATAIDFDLEDPKGVNNIVFLLDAPLESINGTATGITGKVAFDPSEPAAASGRLVVAVESLSVANPKMVEHIMGGQWLDAKKYPEITFDLSKVSDVTQSGNKTTGTAHGVMTIKGTRKEMTVPISLTFLEGKLADRQKTPGDILVIRSTFFVSRSDFGVNAGQSEDKVSDAVELRLSLAGFAPTL